MFIEKFLCITGFLIQIPIVDNSAIEIIEIKNNFKLLNFKNKNTVARTVINITNAVIIPIPIGYINIILQKYVSLYKALNFYNSLLIALLRIEYS